MLYTEEVLTVGVSTRALFNLEKENEVYETEGIEKFRDFQQVKDLVLKMLKVYQLFLRHYNP
jgi:hypothetical protein